MRQCAHTRNSSALLSTTQGSGADEQTSIFAPVAALRPLLSAPIPKGLELGGEVSIAGGDAEEDTVKGLELGRVAENGNVGGLCGSVHFGEDFVGEGFGDSVVWLIWVV